MQVRFDLAMHNKSDGKSQYEKWELFARATGQDFDELIEESCTVSRPEFRVPYSFSYLTEIFSSLSRDREYHSSGIPMPITHALINEYNAAQDEKLSRWEIYTLFAIDDVWLEQMAKERAKQEQVK